MHSTVPFGVILALTFSSLPSLAAAQTPYAHQSTTQPAEGRYEIVQSPIAAKWTFRLDRYRGHVAQLAEAEDGALTWQVMFGVDLPEVHSAQTARFSIFASGIAARFTFLIDSHTGQTWVLNSFSDDVAGWSPFVE